MASTLNKEKYWKYLKKKKTFYLTFMALAFKTMVFLIMCCSSLDWEAKWKTLGKPHDHIQAQKLNDNCWFMYTETYIYSVGSY